MKNIQRKTLRLLLISIIVLSSLGITTIVYPQQVVDQIAAIVEDEIILMSEVQQTAMQQVVYQMGINPQTQPQQFQQAVIQIQPQVLEALINQNIIKAKAEEDSVVVKDFEIEQTMEQQLNSMVEGVGGSEQALEQQLGMTMNQIRDEIRDNVEKQLLIQRYQNTRFANMTVSRKEVEQFYETYKDSIPDAAKQVNLSHIVINTKPSSAADSLAVAQLREIKEQIENGASFSEMAELYSQDPGSRQQGGDLGFVARGSLVPEFEEVAFALNPGEISDVVASEFGYHLIQLEERRGERIHVRHILLSPTPGEEDVQAVIDTLNMLRQKIGEGVPFDSLALQYSEDTEVANNRGNIGWVELPSFQVPEFRSVVDTMEVGEVSAPFQTDLGWHIVQLNDVREGGEVTLDNNWPEIEQMALQQKQAREYQRWLETLRSQFYVSVKIDNTQI